MKTYVKPDLVVATVVNNQIIASGLAGWIQEEAGLSNANITTYVMAS